MAQPKTMIGGRGGDDNSLHITISVNKNEKTGQYEVRQ